MPVEGVMQAVDHAHQLCRKGRLFAEMDVDVNPCLK